MADQATQQAEPTVNAITGGEQVGAKVFTQEQLDAIIAERLNRQKSQYKDYDDLKAKAQKWAEVEEAQKSEAQKMTEAVQRANQERDTALERAKALLIRSAFIAEAARAGAAHPEDVYQLADHSSVSLDEHGNVLGAAEAVKAIVEAGRVPLVAQNRAPALDAGAGSGQRPAEQKKLALTDEELTIARKLRLDPEAYARGKTR